MTTVHNYTATIEWTGNRGQGTASYRAYGRDHCIVIEGKPVLHGSADPVFRGEAAKHNPEDLLVASLSACHMLWYLHLCADAGIIVSAYKDDAAGTMTMAPDGKIRFTSVILHPRVTITQDSDRARAVSLHDQAHEACFIANSVNFPVTCKPTIHNG